MTASRASTLVVVAVLGLPGSAELRRPTGPAMAKVTGKAQLYDSGWTEIVQQ